VRRWGYLAGAIVAEVGGSLSLKAALELPALFAVTALGYIVAFGLLARALRAGMALGVGYGIWGACGVALTALFSHLLFGEPLTGLMALGIGLVIAGVLCVELGAQRTATRERART